MSNFTLHEPPASSGNTGEDLKRLLAWCGELYNNLWISEFLAAQQRKKNGGGGVES